MIKEFKEFLARGNVIDLAVAVVLGVAFNAIIGSLVEDIFTPLIGMLLGGVDFTGLAITVGNAQLTYGNFIQAVINFVLVAFAMFLVVKAYNRFQRKEDVKDEIEEVLEPTQEVLLLTEIRDALVARGGPPTPRL